MSYKNTVKDYSQMIGYITRDKTSRDPSAMDQEPLTMNQGGRIPFAEAPGSVKTKVEGLSKKEKIAQGLEKGRVSTKVDIYRDAMHAYNMLISQARAEADATIIPKSFKSFLESRGLKEGTYGNLNSFDLLPKIELPVKARNTLANDAIRNYNGQLKFKELNKILKDLKFTDKELKALQAGSLDKADKAGDKARKAYDSIFNNPKNLDSEITQFFDPTDKISKLTGLNRSTVSKKFSVKAYDPEGYDLYTKLGNPQIKSAILNRKETFSLKTFKNQKDPLASQAKAAATRKGRLDKAKILAGEGVADINTAQKDVVKLLNDHYKKNPDELLGNTKLRNLLDLTLEDGEIVKKNKYVTDDDFRKLIQDKKGLFTMDHVDEVQFEKLSTEFPIFKQLATYNTNSGLIKSMKSYMSKNQNSKDPAVQNKIKKQVEFLEDLKLRVDTPTGRVGSKEVLAAVDRKAGVLPNFLAQLRALNIKLPTKAKVALGSIGGLSATTLATAEEVSQPPLPGMKPQGSPGQLNPETEKTFAERNPKTTQAAGSAVVGGTVLKQKPVRDVITKGLGKIFRGLGTNLAGSGFAATQIYNNLKEGKGVYESVKDPWVGVELMFPSLFKENISKITKNKAIQKILSTGAVGRYLNPIGGTILAGDALSKIKPDSESLFVEDVIKGPDYFKEKNNDYYEQGEHYDDVGLAGLMKKYYD